MQIRKILVLFLFFFTTTVPLMAAEPKPAEAVAVPTQEAATGPTAPSRSSSPYDNWDEESTKKEAVEETKFGQLFVRMILLLIITLGLLVLAAWASKRFLQGRILGANRSGRIQIIDKLPISAKSCLYIVRVDTQELLIADHATGTQLLKDLPPLHRTEPSKPPGAA